jgi:hypothetical protein
VDDILTKTNLAADARQIDILEALRSALETNWVLQM